MIPATRFKRDMAAVAGFSLAPWAVCASPQWVRVAAVAAESLCAGVLLARARGRPNHTRGYALAAIITATAAATAWIALLSYSGQVSRLPTLLLYGGFATAVLLPFALARRLRAPIRYREYAVAAVLTVSIVLAPPARRFRGGATHPDVAALASRLKTPREMVHWVHRNVTWTPAPFTDTAVDTLHRREARCGGMANLLDKLLKASGFESRVVHFERGTALHTLVEYCIPAAGTWVLADAQHNLDGRAFDNVSGWDVTQGNPRNAPSEWTAYNKLYVYDTRGGYIRVTDSNRDRFYKRRTAEKESP